MSRHLQYNIEFGPPNTWNLSLLPCSDEGLSGVNPDLILERGDKITFNLLKTSSSSIDFRPIFGIKTRLEDDSSFISGTNHLGKTVSEIYEGESITYYFNGQNFTAIRNANVQLVNGESVFPDPIQIYYGPSVFYWESNKFKTSASLNYGLLTVYSSYDFTPTTPPPITTPAPYPISNIVFGNLPYSRSVFLPVANISHSNDSSCSSNNFVIEDDCEGLFKVLDNKIFLTKYPRVGTHNVNVVLKSDIDGLDDVAKPFDFTVTACDGCKELFYCVEDGGGDGGDGGDGSTEVVVNDTNNRNIKGTATVGLQSISRWDGWSVPYDRDVGENDSPSSVGGPGVNRRSVLFPTHITHRNIDTSNSKLSSISDNNQLGFQYLPPQIQSADWFNISNGIAGFEHGMSYVRRDSSPSYIAKKGILNTNGFLLGQAPYDEHPWQFGETNANFNFHFSYIGGCIRIPYNVLKLCPTIVTSQSLALEIKLYVGNEVDPIANSNGVNDSSRNLFTTKIPLALLIASVNTLYASRFYNWTDLVLPPQCFAQNFENNARVRRDFGSDTNYFGYYDEYLSVASPQNYNTFPHAAYPYINQNRDMIIDGLNAVTCVFAPNSNVYNRLLGLLQHHSFGNADQDDELSTFIPGWRVESEFPFPYQWGIDARRLDRNFGTTGGLFDFVLSQEHYLNLDFYNDVVSESEKLRRLATFCNLFTSSNFVEFDNTSQSTVDSVYCLSDLEKHELYLRSSGQEKIYFSPTIGGSGPYNADNPNLSKESFVCDNGSGRDESGDSVPLGQRITLSTLASEHITNPDSKAYSVANMAAGDGQYVLKTTYRLVGNTNDGTRYDSGEISADEVIY